MSSSPTPFTPPTTEEERLAFLRLIRSRRVGPATFHRLIDAHGTPAAALAALPAVARAAGEEGYAPCPAESAAAELAEGRALGGRPLFFGMPDYPPQLADLPDAPPMLWVLGDPALLVRPMVALVGMRNASSLGLRMARRLAEGLGMSGLVVVSGLARGVDAAAHAAALPTGTVAAVAGGIDIVYPAENAALAAEIASRGALLSEHPPGLAPQARHFPVRNRIVAGLALGVVVVEAAERSGSLITARAALDQARVVMAVPGHPLDPRAAGTNALLREGAVLVRDTEDAAAALAPALATHAADAAARRRVAAPEPAAAAMRPAPSQPAAAPRPAGDGAPAPRPLAAAAALATARELHGAILDRLGAAPLAEDQLLRDLALPPATVAPALLDLELDGRIARQPGGLIARLH
ncbi:MAG: DNA-processing protein DprA [Rhodobacteraceae bacterium]|jgi:DNA processing protein|nr:DNA-processing protein DprA [Paracoccaceae bacterium]